MIPYNVLPIEAHVAMITAEQANIPVLVDAARMWVEVRAWIEAARVELHTKANNLSPTWTDDAGRALEEKFQRSLAELKTWGDRIDGAQVVETLTTLASAIPQTFQAVMGFHQSYLAALSNPFTIGLAPAFQQAAGTAMTGLGMNFDQSMVKVCAAAGITSPGDLLPGTGTGSSADAAAAIETATQAMTALQSLSSAGSDLVGMVTGSGGSTGPGINGLDGLGTFGPSLAGLGDFGGTALQSTAIPGAGVPSSGSAPTSFGGLGLSGAGSGAGLSTVAKPVAGKRAPSTAGAEVRPGTATTATAKASTPPGGMPPPMMPPQGGQSQAGTLRPGSSDQPTGRARKSRRTAEGTDGVPAELRGRAGRGDPGFVAPRRRRAPGDDESVRLLDEDLWQVDPRDTGGRTQVG